MEAVLDPNWPNPVRGRWRPKLRTARPAVSTLFFVNGALFATWVSRIPAIQSTHGLGHGSLGVALLAAALGAVIAMPLAGWLSTRLGSETVSKAAVLVFAAALPLLAIAPNALSLMLLLLVFGASHGALDVAVNAQAVAVERRFPRPIMSSFHALFSTGGLFGAAAGAVLAILGLPAFAHFALVALLLAASAFATFPHLLRTGKRRHESEAPKVASTASPLPSRGLLALGAVALCIMVGEGAMADWSAVFLRNEMGTTEGLAAVGYAAFSIAMALGRFAGDRLTARFDAVRLVQLSGLLAATGLLMALLLESSSAAIAGFACVGAGFATVVPMVFSAAGRTHGVAPDVALASVTTMGYIGFLAGPPLIGFLAEAIGLRGALGLIVTTSLLAAALAPAVRRRR